MSNEDEAQREADRLGELLPVYLCERTGLSMEKVIQVLEAQENFWNSQRHVVGHMLVLGFDIEDDDAR